MFCKKCGAKIADDSNFCSVCGAAQGIGEATGLQATEQNAETVEEGQDIGVKESVARKIGRVIWGAVEEVGVEYLHDSAYILTHAMAKKGRKSFDRGLKRVGLKKKSPFEKMADSFKPGKRKGKKAKIRRGK